MAPHGRIAVCGRVASDSSSVLERPELILIRQLRLQGFIVPSESFAPARAHLRRLLESGQIKAEHTMRTGIENAPHEFFGMFQQGSAHFGKLLIKL